MKLSFLLLGVALTFASCNRFEESFEVHEDVTIAINTGDVASVEAWVRSGGDPNAGGYVDGINPIHMASSMHQVEILNRLMDAGGDARTPDSAGNTPLHYAAKNGVAWAEEHPKARTIAFLLEAGGDSEAKNAAGETAGELALKVNNDKIANRLLTKQAEQDGAGQPTTRSEFE